jgi:hypothetical protein
VHRHALGGSRRPYRGAERLCSCACRSGTTAAEVPRRQLEEIVAHAATDSDAFYSEPQAHAISNADEAGPILVLSMDGKGVVMRKADLRAPTSTRGCGPPEFTR